MSKHYLNFEEPLKSIDEKIESLISTGNKTGVDVSHQVISLKKELKLKREEIYNNLSRWERVQLARHPLRPNSLDYIHYLMKPYLTNI